MKLNKKIVIILLVVVGLLAVLLTMNTAVECEYNGEMDLSYVKQTIDNNEFYLFEDDNQKYILYKEEVTTNSPNDIKIKSINIIKNNYNLENELILQVNVTEDITYVKEPEGISTDGISSDSRFIIMKVKENCSGLIVNGTKYNKYDGGIIFDIETLPIKYGYVDSNGSLAIPIEYDEITELENSYYDDIKNTYVDIDYSDYLEIYKKDTGRGIASKSGKILINCQYDNIINYEKNSFVVDTRDNKIGIIDINGNLLKGFIDGSIYNSTFSIKPSFKEYTFFWQNGHVGVIDRELNIIIEPTYNIIQKINDNYLQVTKLIDEESRNGYHGVIDLNNNVVVPINIYEERIYSYSTLRIEYNKGEFYYYENGTKHIIKKDVK